jgi:hypothetical protein
VTQEFPIELMDNVVCRIVKLTDSIDAGQTLIAYNEFYEFLLRVLLDKKRDTEKTAREIRTILKRKKIKLSIQPEIPFGTHYELFKRIPRNSDHPYKEFKELLYNEIKNRAKTKETKYNFAYALNLNLPDEVDSKICEMHNSKKVETAFKIIPYGKFAGSSILQDVFKRTEKENVHKIFNDQFSFCIIGDFCARDDDYALDCCNRKLTTILGLLALGSSGGTVTYGAKAAAASKIALSYVLVFKNDKYDNYRWFGEKEPPSSSENVDTAELERFLRDLKRFNNIKAEAIKEKLSDALTSYFEASVEDDMANAYLKYWTCLESCLLSTPQSTQEKTILRLKGLPFWRDPYKTHHILLMPQVRNEYVHELKINVTQFERNFMLYVAANLIWYTLQIGSKLSSRDELDLFLDLVTTADLEHLNSHERVTKLALKEIEDFSGVRDETK